MKILLDECLPRRLAQLLPGHDVRTVRQMNWLGLSNGALLDAAVDFDCFVTIDKSLLHQQQLKDRRIAVVVLTAPTNRIEDLKPLLPQLLQSLDNMQPGTIVKLP